MKKQIAGTILIYVFFSISIVLCARDGEKPFFQSGPIFEPEKVPFEECHGSTLVELSNGDIMAAWYAGDYERAKNSAIYAALLKKGESGWSEPRIIHDTPDLGDGNPALWMSPEGALWLFYNVIEKDKWNDARIYCKKSTDDGDTWTKPVLLTKKAGWLTRNKPLRLSNGDILLPMQDEVIYRSQFLISSDDGESWERSAFISAPGGNVEPAVVQLSDGTLLAGMRTGSSNGLQWWASSNSNGRKWSKPFTREIKNPGSALDMVRLENGHLGLAFNDSAGRRNPLTIAISTDEGQTWPVKRDLERDDAGFYCYPAMIASADGLIHVSYTYNRKSIKYSVFNEAWVLQKNKER